MRTMLSRHDTLLAQLACVTRAMRTLAAHHVTVERIEIGSTDMPILHIECGGALTELDGQDMTRWPSALLFLLFFAEVIRLEIEFLQ